MNPTKTIAFAFVAFASALLTHAQTAPTATPVGVLGQRYSEVSFGAQDLKGVSRNLYTVGLNGNTPVSTNLDAGLGYGYSWIGGANKGHANTLSASATGYTAMNGVKPFATGGLGYQWLNGSGRRTNYGLWTVAVGVEIPAGAFSVTPYISYNDDMQRSRFSSQQYNYGADVNYWLSTTSAVTAGISYSDELHGSGSSWNYVAGYRWKF